MDTKAIGLWTFFGGMVLALVTVFVNLGGWASHVLIILGLVAGFFHHHFRDNLLTLGVTYLALSVAQNSTADLLLIGPYIADITAAWVRFLGPVVLMAFMVWAGAFLISGKKR